MAGGWRHGKIDQKKAVEEMKRYAFAGLGVFDLADICEFFYPLGPSLLDCFTNRFITVLQQDLKNANVAREC